jgi:alkanesulfonate monooxygenase SsuD/methylene tetrahydromethanopterin reductase-like flavin-dependent oxidoreductase (luciferase family)
MDFGTFHLYSAPPWTDVERTVQDHLRQMVAVDQFGFDEIWLAEHCTFADGEFLPVPKQAAMPPTYIMVSGSERSVLRAAERLLPIVIGSGPGWSDVVGCHSGAQGRQG